MRMRSSVCSATLDLMVLLLWICLFLPLGDAIWLNLPGSGTKCVSEEIQNNVVVLADYTVVSDDRTHEMPAISAKVTSPYGNNLHHTKNVTHGQFAFTANEAGNYLACFWVEGPNKEAGASVNLDWRIGIAARDWDSVARKEKIEGVELELRKLEGAVEAIHENLLYLKTREAEMREVSETTNSRVAWFSIMSLGLCICVSVLQLWHLKHYFRKKKLI
ncbi:transmembrane emp24 domain-containing protein p24delta3-like [Telopea speciosissima]|uniref:transmembrane emp24 domain-containing protein p24delta3-like n=1 Tax=Telopea speciosissima TaxID=54955 RepID=UPI001CC3AEDA|nr:transmembrane emp24 domain-containing protein p24delta3-like [Telopea speciosissima]XP_043704318.1 transmembrane emp24 domain-containing protein p24delta3-like [Telopea speciosissima]XP_043704319.1 transmembrane emp24 domain-containing protein p24delta3-like [Telopea speciosissima]